MNTILTSIPDFPGGTPPETVAAFRRARDVTYAHAADHADGLGSAFINALRRGDAEALWAIASVAEQRGTAPGVVSAYRSLFASPNATEPADPVHIGQQVGAAYLYALPRLLYGMLNS